MSKKEISGKDLAKGVVKTAISIPLATLAFVAAIISRITSSIVNVVNTLVPLLIKTATKLDIKPSANLEEFANFMEGKTSTLFGLAFKWLSLPLKGIQSMAESFVDSSVHGNPAPKQSVISSAVPAALPTEYSTPSPFDQSAAKSSGLPGTSPSAAKSPPTTKPTPKRKRRGLSPRQ